MLHQHQQLCARNLLRCTQLVECWMASTWKSCPSSLSFNWGTKHQTRIALFPNMKNMLEALDLLKNNTQIAKAQTRSNSINQHPLVWSCLRLFKYCMSRYTLTVCAPFRGCELTLRMEVQVCARSLFGIKSKATTCAQRSQFHQKHTSQETA